MIYVKTPIFFIGLWALAIHQWALSTSAATATWLGIFLLLRFVLARVAGRAASRTVVRFALLAAIIWTAGALLVGGLTLSFNTHQFWTYAFEMGAVRAIRFSCALAWSFIVMTWLAPDELYSLTWLPVDVRQFLLVFRVAVTRSVVLMGDILDRVYSLGLPHGRALLAALISQRSAFPSHGRWRERRWTRFTIAGETYLAAIVTYLDTLVSIELPEIDATYRTLSGGVR